MKEIQATAPTPQDWVELVRENERLKEKLRVSVMLLSFDGYMNYTKAVNLIDCNTQKSES